ncbi:MAG: hypothetical protein JRI25_14940 [Deltaproteobacteria bacterium]|nr:hypothetical protein [Deltaproteobacteria bacterium]
MSWNLVRAWRDRLRQRDPSFLPTGLSPEGAREALKAALDALDDESLDRIAALGGRAFPTAAVVCSTTVTTAPIEWCAVLLGRGSAVLLKYSADDPGLSSLLVSAARDVGLPLVGVTERAAILQADLVVVMGSDDTVREIRSSVSARVRLLPHGHRFSAAWITGNPLPPDTRVPESFQGSWGGVAADCVLHDGRGCLSPVAVFTPVPLETACDRLADAMFRASSRWPTGTVSPSEHAHIRSRRALARVTGQVREGRDFSIHGLPVEHMDLVALPRCLAVYQVEDATQAARALAPYARWLSTIGTDDPESVGTWLSLGATRVCRQGRMQRPPVIRPHDGEDWLHGTTRWISEELDAETP